MRSRFDIRPARTPADLAAVTGLFRAYAASLPVGLDYQDFEGELAGLPGKYAPPGGELLLAVDAAGAPHGCVALRPLAPAGVCEMQRLYINPAARGAGLGRALAERIVETARRLGYRELRLDTLPSMGAAQGLYAGLGFIEIAPYYAPTPEGTAFLALRL